MAWLYNWAYSLSDEGIWAHLYGGSTLECEWKGSRVALTQETDYPWDGLIRITVDHAPAKAMALRLRIPAWTRAATLTVNGEAVEATAGSYASIERVWADGDVVELSLDMTPVMVEAHPLIEETRNQVAVVRGPMVYCVESCDVPEGVPLNQVTLPADAVLNAAYDPNLLGGVVAITTRALRRESPDFGGGLYAPVSANAGEPIDVRFVPYYAWWNRGNQAMTIWVPRA